MKYMNQTISYVMGVLALLTTGCDNPVETDALTAGGTSEVVFSGEESGFGLVQTRATTYPIGGTTNDGSGPDFGTFYMLQIPDPNNTSQQPTKKGPFWGKYHVPEGASGVLEAVNSDETTDKLRWEEPNIKYYFRGINAPRPIDSDTESAVTFNYDAKQKDLKQATGTVTFGDYKGGLEYFVGATSTLQALTDGTGKKVSIMFRRQVCKVVFQKFTHKNASQSSTDEGTALNGPLEIIFPNLPRQATFNMNEFHEQEQVTTGWSDRKNYVTLHPVEDGEYGVSMTWEKVQTNKDKEEEETEHPALKNPEIKQALYLIPFVFWDNSSGKAEDQSGFFIVKYDGKTYTGNITGQNYTDDGKVEDKANQLYPAHRCVLNVTLQDGPVQGGGDGSIIVGWSTVGEEITQHPPVPGIYSQEDAKKLLEALKSGKSENIPVSFYREETITDASGTEKTVQVIRLFKNIDWSEVTDTELTIPDGFVLMGQGYNVTLGDGTSIKGEQEGKLYINGVLYEDGQGPTAFLLHTFCSATANVLQFHCI